MITLRNVYAGYKAYDFTQPSRSVLRDINFSAGRQDRIALLGDVGSGKTTVLRLLAGIIPPSSGSIDKGLSVSFPIGFSGASNRMTLAQYIYFIARCYSVDPVDLRHFVMDICDASNDMLDRQYSRVQSDLKSRINAAIGYGIPFDLYLFDQRTFPGEPKYRSRFRAVFERRLSSAGMVLATRSPRLARQLCKSGAVLHDKTLTCFANIEDAVSFYSKVSPAAFSANDEVYYQPL